MMDLRSRGSSSIILHNGRNYHIYLTKCECIVTLIVQILLVTDEILQNKHWTDKSIAKACLITEKTAGSVRKRFVEQSFPGCTWA